MTDFEIAFSRDDLPSPALSWPEAARGEAAVTVPSPVSRAAFADMVSQSSLTRPVYCVLGIPIDAVDMTTVVRKIEAATAKHAAFLLSTPNLNFLVSSLSDPEFKQSLLDSDLCPPDGVPIIWIARLLGLPIKERAAGADLLDRLRLRGTGMRRLTIFLFGGAKGVAAAAAKTLNAKPGGLNCIGTMDPGFCEVSEMSHDHIISEVNSSGADFLVLSLGAKKGQLWLQRNHDRLTIPIRAHLGAAVGFQAGVIKRAPPLVRAWGLEWLWRIKEEHHLWKRYRHDGWVLLRLLLTRVLPLAALSRWHLLKQRLQPQDLIIRQSHDEQSITISLSGIASEAHVAKAIPCFEGAIAGGNRDVIVDLSNTRQIDARFFGLLLMLRKELRSRGAKLLFTGVSPAVKRLFRLNELEFLLSTHSRA
jgi:N-acetylglucosaminyldiphosphoundecaprenol N-acetyl-beta-D-mannosaminyltransferase